MNYYNRDDNLSFGGESVKVLPLRFVGFICTLYCLFPCFSSSQRDLLVCFYLKEFLSHYKFTPLACFLVKYLGHGCNMGRPVLPPCCLCPVITAVGPFLLDPDCPVGPLSAPYPGWGWPLPVLFGQVPGDLGRPWS